ncbi:MAG: metallophosphoesterase [Phycisphaerales bacterium]|nr:metallophosphoesterase [Phycisphaerales bacterium]
MSEAGFALLCAVSVLLDLAVGWAALFGPSRGGSRQNTDPRPMIRLGHVIIAAVVTAIVFPGKCAVLQLVGLRLFGAMTLALWALAVVPPVIGAALLMRHVRARRAGRRYASLPVLVTAMLSLPMLPIALHAVLIEPFRLQLETMTIAIPAARQCDAPLRVGVLADIQATHVTDYDIQAVDRLMALEPDIVVLPGDLYQRRLEDLADVEESFRALLRRLSAPGGVYIVPGDHDQPQGLARIVEGTDVTLLLNESVMRTVRGTRVMIGGIENDYRSPAARHLIRRMEEAEGAVDIRLLVAHRPDAVKSLAHDSRIDLVIAGHTHGGQVSLPIVGPPITLSTLPRRICAGGYHTWSGNGLYVSRGVGYMHGQAPRVRFLCPPEISLLILETPNSTPAP